MSSESSRSDSRVSAPMRRKPSASWMYASPGIPLMSTTCFGVARRSFMSGMRLWPPDSTFASSPSLASSRVASPIDVGAWYSKAAGIIVVPPWPAAERGPPARASSYRQGPIPRPKKENPAGVPRGVSGLTPASLEGSRRCFDGAPREDLEQVALVLLGALEVSLDVDSVGRLLRRGLDGGGVERLAREPGLHTLRPHRLAPGAGDPDARLRHLAALHGKHG